MNTKKSLALLGAIGALVAAHCASAAGPGSGPGPSGTNNVPPGGGTNYNHYINHYSYSNHWAFTNEGGARWWTNVSRWADSPAPHGFTNRHRVLAPEGTGPRAEPPGPRPDIGKPLTPADVQALVKQFQADREAFMAQQRALEQQMSGAGEQDRQRLRDQLQTQMEQFKRQQARLREQLRDQVSRMRDQLRDHHRLMDKVGNPDTPGDRPRGNR